MKRAADSKTKTRGRRAQPRTARAKPKPVSKLASNPETSQPTQTGDGAGYHLGKPAFRDPHRSNVDRLRRSYHERQLNTDLLQQVLVAFIRAELHKIGTKRAVLGLSGGVDSALVAYLAASALGPENVTGIIMPYRTSSPDSQADAELVAKNTKIHAERIDITPQIDAYFKQFKDASSMRRGNKMARERMTILYDHSAALGALVLGTSNKTELFLGYGTIYGDMASAINPIGDLYKTQVRALAHAVGVPKRIIEKHPSADLWAGQTDESELGFTYAEVDELLHFMVERRYRHDELMALGFEPRFVQRVEELVTRSQYKRRMPLIAKVSGRSIGHDFRYPRDWKI